jgi:hypothetical protein
MNAPTSSHARAVAALVHATSKIRARLANVARAIAVGGIAGCVAATGIAETLGLAAFGMYMTALIVLGTTIGMLVGAVRGLRASER